MDKQIVDFKSEFIEKLKKKAEEPGMRAQDYSQEILDFDKICIFSDNQINNLFLEMELKILKELYNEADFLPVPKGIFDMIMEMVEFVKHIELVSEEEQ